MITKTMNPIHIHHRGIACTLFVFPYPAISEWDVEIHKGHVPDNSNFDTYRNTVTLDRDTHLIADLWDDLDDIVRGF